MAIYILYFKNFCKNLYSFINEEDISFSEKIITFLKSKRFWIIELLE